MEQETILFDGECAVCRTLKGVAEKQTREDGLVFAAFQTADLARLSPGLTPEMANQAMYLVQADGRRIGGARAVFAVMRRMKGIWRLLGAVLAPISPLAEPFYRLFARHRHRLASLLARWERDKR